MSSAFAVNLAATLGVVLAVQLAAFAVGVRSGRHAVADTVWGLGFAAVALAGFGLSSGHGDPAVRTLVTVMTVAWGLRLAVHLGLRSRGQGEDPRYEEMLARATDNRTLYALRVVYLTQGAAMWFVSLPVQAAQYAPRYTGAAGAAADALTGLGVALWLTGMVFEGVGDRQLARFRADPANRGTVMDRGLWRYTRHPNYFGDACMWWGLFLVACRQPLGVLTASAPLAMTYLLAAKTGKPMLEGRMAVTRPGYADYAARTSGFLPRFPKKEPR